MGEGAFISVFGPPRVRTKSAGPILFPTQRSRNLLLILVLEKGGAVTRERLFDLLWAQAPPAQPHRAINNELWRLRKALGPAASILLSDTDTIALQRENLSVDLYAFDEAVSLARSGGSEAGTAAAKVEQIYTCELLAGLFDDWCLIPREGCRARFVETMEKLLETQVASRTWREAIRTARRILEEDPLLEHVHREVMRCWRHLGNRAAAIRQYDELRLRLKKELGVDPSPETRALRETIGAEDGRTERGAVWQTQRVQVAEGIAAVSSALRQAEVALERLQQSLMRSPD